MINILIAGGVGFVAGCFLKDKIVALYHKIIK